MLIFDYEFALESCKKNEVSQVSTSQVIGQNTLIQKVCRILWSSTSQEGINALDLSIWVYLATPKLAKIYKGAIG